MKQLIIMFLCAFLFACTSANKGRIGNEQDIVATLLASPGPCPCLNNDIKNNYDGPNFIFAKDLQTDSIVYRQQNYHYDIKAVVQNGIVKDQGYPFSYGFNDNLFWWKHQSVDTIYCTSDF